MKIDSERGFCTPMSKGAHGPSQSARPPLIFRCPCYRQPVLRTMHMKTDDDPDDVPDDVPEPAGLGGGGGGGGGGRGYVGHLVACLDGTFIPRLFGPDRDMLRLLLLNHRSAREDANPPGKKSPFLSLFPIFGRRKKKRCKKSRRSSASTKFNSASLSSAAACSRSHLEYATVAHGRIPPFFASALPCTAIFFGKRPLSKKMPAPKKRQRPALDYEAPG